jgi:hypothetical protein
MIAAAMINIGFLVLGGISGRHLAGIRHNVYDTVTIYFGNQKFICYPGLSARHLKKPLDSNTMQLCNYNCLPTLMGERLASVAC